MTPVSGIRRRVVRLAGTNAARASSWAMLGQLAAILSSTANFLLLARLVGPESYGLIAGSWALVLTLGPVARLGSDRLIVRDVTGDRPVAREALGAALTTVLAGTSTVMLALVLLHGVLLPQVPLMLLVSLALADLMALGFITCLTSLCYALDAARAAALLSVGLSLARLAAVVVFALSGSTDPVRWAVIYAAFVGTIALAEVMWASWRFGRPALVRYHPLVRARHGLPYSANAVAHSAQNDIDKALLVRNGYVEEAGIYSVAYRLASIAYLPALAVLQAMFARFFTVGARGGLVETVALARRLARPLGAYGVLAAVALVVTAPLIPVLIGDRYRESVVLVMLLAPLTLLKILQSVQGDALTGAGRQATRTACVTTSAVVNGALNVALIPQYGLAAALLATFVAETLQVALLALALRRGRRRAAERVA